MEEKKFIQLKKDELGVKEFIKKSLGKGRISNVIIEYTPVGEKIIVSTTGPGFVIGRKGERITQLTEILKKRFNLENPHIEIQEIIKPEFDAQAVADSLALAIERFGNIRFKSVAYNMLKKIMGAGALGAEIRLSGKLPSERAKSWRFAQGLMKKTGDPAKIVGRAKAVAQTKPGTTGIKVSILAPGQKIHDRIEIDDFIKNKIKEAKEPVEENKKK